MVDYTKCVMAKLSFALLPPCAAATMIEVGCVQRCDAMHMEKAEKAGLNRVEQPTEAEAGAAEAGAAEAGAAEAGQPKLGQPKLGREGLLALPASRFNQRGCRPHSTAPHNTPHHPTPHHSQHRCTATALSLSIVRHSRHCKKQLSSRSLHPSGLPALATSLITLSPPAPPLASSPSTSSPHSSLHFFLLHAKQRAAHSSPCGAGCAG